RPSKTGLNVRSWSIRAAPARLEPRNSPEHPPISARRRFRVASLRYVQSNRIDAAESVPYRGAGSGQQHPHEARLLVFAVEADARQRRQVLAVLGEQHAGPGSDRGLEPELARD